jgi:hypothetical protein
MTAPPRPNHLRLEESASFDRSVIDYIQHAAATGLYEIPGLGAKRHVPHFDDLVFLAGSASRYPLEGYREKCTTKTVLGTRFAKKPIELLSRSPSRDELRSLSARVKEALGRAAGNGHGTTTGDGGRREERPPRGRSSTSACLRVMGSTPTICGRPTPSKSSSARAPNPVAEECCWARR